MYGLLPRPLYRVKLLLSRLNGVELTQGDCSHLRDMERLHNIQCRWPYQGRIRVFVSLQQEQFAIYVDVALHWEPFSQQKAKTTAVS